MAAVIGALRVNLGLNSAEFEQGMKKAQGALGGISKAFAALGGVALFAGLTTGIGQAVGRIEEMRKLTAQLDQALANTGNTAKTSGSEVEKFADKLERSTGRAAEEVLAVSTNLATFGFNRQVFFEAIELADDMSAAWGGDLKQNVEGLARALADPEKGLAMLTKRGITFTDQQKAMIAGFIKSNDLLGAQGVILDTLQEQVSGVAEAGFGGLTKAQANATMALEGFFETIANSLGVNLGLEMGLVAVAAALDFVTANIDVLARVAGVAGTAIAVALGPTIWATVSAAAVAMSTTVVTAIRAIGIAIAANPIGLIITALAAAVAAAFLFRDEIKQAIGVDFVGIIAGAVNTVIGAFVGAFEAIKATWSMLPAALGDLVYQAAESTVNGVIYMIRAVQEQINRFTSSVNGVLNQMGSNVQLPNMAMMDYADLGNPFAGKAGEVGAAASAAFAGAQGDYVGKLAESLGFVGDEATTAAAGITALGTAMDGGGETGGGGASGGAKNLGAAADATKDKLKGLADTGKQVTDTLKEGFKELFKGFVTGSGNAMEAISGLIGKLADLFINKGFDMLFGLIGGFGMSGGMKGVSSITGSSGGFFPGFASGGAIMPGGSGGIDSQLVQFWKSPNERVDITKPGQSLGSGTGGAVSVDVNVSVDDSGNLVPLVTRVSGQVAGQAIKQNNKQLPGLMRDVNQRVG